MTTNGTTDAIRAALLASPYVGDVATIAIDESGSTVAVRFSVCNIRDVFSIPPLMAELRASIRRTHPLAKDVFLEPDFTERRAEPLSTEAIVIRGWD